MNRRGFIIATLAAPAIVTYRNLMPIRMRAPMSGLAVWREAMEEWQRDHNQLVLDGGGFITLAALQEAVRTLKRHRVPPPYFVHYA